MITALRTRMGRNGWRAWMDGVAAHLHPADALLFFDAYALPSGPVDPDFVHERAMEVGRPAFAMCLNVRPKNLIRRYDLVPLPQELAYSWYMWLYPHMHERESYASMIWALRNEYYDVLDALAFTLNFDLDGHCAWEYYYRNAALMRWQIEKGGGVNSFWKMTSWMLFKPASGVMELVAARQNDPRFSLACVLDGLPTRASRISMKYQVQSRFPEEICDQIIPTK